MAAKPDDIKAYPVESKPIDWRPSLDQVLLNVTKQIAQRSTCKHRQMGAILTSPTGQILASGYNGAPTGAAHCTEIGCIRDSVESGTRHELCRAVHAEQNCIVQAAKLGVSVEGSTCYCTNQPCTICAKLLVNVGVIRVVYLYDYPDKRALAILEEGGIEIVHWGCSV